MYQEFFELTLAARSPRELEVLGVKELLSIIKKGRAITDVCIFNTKDGCHLESDCKQEGAVSLAFVYEPSEQKKFYAFFVIEEEQLRSVQTCLPDYFTHNPFHYFKKVFNFQFSWDYDKSEQYRKMHVLLLEMPFSKEHFIVPDADQTYWTPYLHSGIILYGGISAFLTALQNNRYVVGMAYKTQGKGCREEISIGFVTEPLGKRDMQILFFSTYYGQDSLCEHELNDDLKMMSGYKVLDKLVLPDFCCNYFTACLVAHV